MRLKIHLENSFAGPEIGPTGRWPTNHCAQHLAAAPSSWLLCTMHGLAAGHQQLLATRAQLLGW